MPVVVISDRRRPDAPTSRRAANEQRVPGRTEAIQYETADGKWLTETASGSVRPDTEVEDGR